MDFIGSPAGKLEQAKEADRKPANRPGELDSEPATEPASKPAGAGAGASQLSNGTRTRIDSRTHPPYPHCMEIKVLDLEKEPYDFDLSFQPGAVDLGEEAVQIGLMAAGGRAEVIHEHRGPKEVVADIRIKGRYEGCFEVPCARCIEPVQHRIAAGYDLIFRPAGVDAAANERAIHAPDLEIDYYENGSLLLEDVLREQVLLSLPARSLCKPDCKGLCPRCGQNRNQTACACNESQTDPRWQAMAELRSRIKS
jgi:uncharacterized protein